MRGLDEPRVAADEFEGVLAGLLQQVGVAEQVGDSQFGQAVLAGAEELARPHGRDRRGAVRGEGLQPALGEIAAAGIADQHASADRRLAVEEGERRHDNAEEERERRWDSVADLRMMGRFVEVYMKLWYAQKPTIAAVQGWCIGGGTDMVLCADMIVAVNSS